MVGAGEVGGTRSAGWAASVTGSNATAALDYPWHVPQLRRQSPSEPAEPARPAGQGDASTRPAGKGRPTPSRKESEAARRTPLVPTDRKAAARASRAAAKAVRDREYQAMQTGDERYLPLRDRGPVRRWIRDTVDARFNLAEWLLPISLGMVVAMFVADNFQTEAVALGVLLLLWVVMLAVLVDAVLLGRRLRKGVAARFGGPGQPEVPRGATMYGVMRAFQVRPMRLPKPQVTRGKFPA